MTQVQKSDETAYTLGLLDAVEEDVALTQRRVAADLGVALGLANALIRRCVRKGLIKVTSAPAGRYVYYMTPKGFAEKSRLTAEYLKTSLNFFRQARDEMASVMDEARARGWQRVALVGAGELAEIATLAVRETSIELVCVVDAAVNRPSVFGVPVVANAADAGLVDGVILTDVTAPRAAFERACEEYGADRVLAPPLLRVRRRNGSRAA
ncbi:MAG: winged helix-turn-helix transcriptional regulator [Alphaproteobacteria bacterium]